MVVFISLLLIMIVCGTTSVKQEHVFLYNTENGPSEEKFHCVYHGSDNIPFCHRWPLVNFTSAALVETRCHHGGQWWNFSALVTAGVEPYDVLKWASSVKKADDYAAYSYFHKQSDQEFMTDSFLCDCSNDKETFGKLCEYRLMNGAQSIEETLAFQFSLKVDYWKFRLLNGHIPCYTTLECDSGLLCLEWRDICDGHQNCMNGWDEINCDILEFYECDENEYRCSNGLCIPDVYFLDGKVVENEDFAENILLKSSPQDRFPT